MTRSQTARAGSMESDAVRTSGSPTDTARPKVSHARRGRSVWSALARHWPAAVGAVLAAVVAYEFPNATAAEGAEQALIIAIPVFVYLTAAVLDRPRSSWPALGASLIVIFGFGTLGIDPVAGLATVSAAVLVVGVAQRLWRRRTTPATVQILGAVGFGTAALLALHVSPTLGGFLVGIGLLAHAVWDVIHYRRTIVVARSLAEFCAVLDTLVGLAVIALTVATMG